MPVNVFDIRALKSMVASGYKSTTHALSELVDNSFDAGANNVRILFLEKQNAANRLRVNEVLVIDDGEGMDQDTLGISLQIGGGVNRDEDILVSRRKIGKFGFGLPVASLNQCNRVEIYTWQKQGEVITNYLDLDDQLASGSVEMPEVQEVEGVPSEYAQIGDFNNQDSGTLIAWKECERLNRVTADSNIEHARRYLGRIFRYLIKNGKTISLEKYEWQNGSQQFAETQKEFVVCNDPLYLTEKCYLARVLHDESQPTANSVTREYFEKFSVDQETCEPTNIKLEDCSFQFEFPYRGKRLQFEITTSYAHLDIQKPGISKGGHTGIGQQYGKKMDLGNITFVRSDREIDSGDFGFYNKTENAKRWLTIEIRFSPDADTLLGVSNNKQSISFRKLEGRDGDDLFDDAYDEYHSSEQEAQAELTRLLTQHIGDAHTKAWKEVRTAAKKWEAAQGGDAPAGGGEQIPEPTPITIEVINQIEGELQLTDEKRGVIRSA